MPNDFWKNDLREAMVIEIGLTNQFSNGR